MAKFLPLFALVSFFIIFPLPTLADNADREEIINELTRLIQQTTSKEKLANYYCHRARNHTKLGNMEQAEADYISAIGNSYVGWLISEFGEFLFFTKQYEKAYNLSHKLEDDFPHFAKQANTLKKKAKEKYDEEYYKENPPTIVIDTVPNYAYKSRIQVINEVKARDAMMVIPNQIAENCRREWGSDQRMVDFCIKQQSSAHEAVSSYGMDEIKRRCQREWGDDYRMVEFCIKQQRGSRSAVAKQRGGIRSRCEQEWGDDYRMVEFCIKQQTEARSSINRTYSNSSKRAECERQWGTDYRMVEFCIKN
ncbi:hypothetical protein [Desulfofustis limnaeus]|uniref:Uncharacterized protein n=1 Tax=Desulfofustis limnaeus TaxID=2740163 RepID=A0ABM7WCJ7_9BACT|nr:hypothetical protein [Desulfofustis limnaeus]BDD88735.1 hypothetical protein DPPLL_31000 [Desulfofustis limnaeus]